MSKKKKNSMLKNTAAKAIPLSIALTMMSTGMNARADALQVELDENAGGYQAVEFGTDYVADSANKEAVRDALIDGLISGKKVLIEEETGWVNLQDYLNPGYSYDTDVEDGSDKSSTEFTEHILYPSDPNFDYYYG